ncbi:thiamine phosphate synthase [Sedimentitalea nanhaiensis]|uniref:Thiamine-phosphate pyrophosphorylase n=1 Tax=Sedimentitalea nanhaiensis TaxID=999627 RepID=A0A1I6YJ79_9RHOB|nr:thiamine phosphate synthase [Sedimentitalea nanhaiensis]SFT50579.1 thiamine-phosphate pyrophosphorylase [Sedimentitalea nanhaiensis]
MDSPEQPQIYLLTPATFELSQFPDRLARVLDSTAIACIRLALASRDEDQVARAADALREVAHARDVALVIDDHVLLAERLGLDGVHLSDAARTVRWARKTLGPDAIVGSFCGVSRHDGLAAGEAGADYISFGPVSRSALGDGSVAEIDLFEWWSKMIEVPVVAEGALTAGLIAALTPCTDFFGIGDEIWQAEDPIAALKPLLDAMEQAAKATQ